MKKDIAILHIIEIFSIEILHIIEIFTINVFVNSCNELYFIDKSVFIAYNISERRYSFGVASTKIRN